MKHAAWEVAGWLALPFVESVCLLVKCAFLLGLPYKRLRGFIAALMVLWLTLEPQDARPSAAKETL